jgi:hypothetical protein
VSAQQARERKKAYLTDLEVKVKDLEKKNSEMEERLSTLQNENQMLRQVHIPLVWLCFWHIQISVLFNYLSSCQICLVLLPAMLHRSWTQ